jgi:hypothetical protein
VGTDREFTLLEYEEEVAGAQGSGSLCMYMSRSRP